MGRRILFGTCSRPPAGTFCDADSARSWRSFPGRLQVRTRDLLPLARKGAAGFRTCPIPGHDFWFDDLPLRNAVAPGTLLGGHRQVTDAYLLALASAHGGVLATLDRGAAALARGGQLVVELIG